MKNEIESSNDEDLGNLFNVEPDKSAQTEAIREMNNPENIKMKSRVSKAVGEAHYFAKLELLGDLLKWHELKDYCRENLMHRVSEDREGRKESVRIVQSFPQQEQKKGMFRRLMG